MKKLQTQLNPYTTLEESFEMTGELSEVISESKLSVSKVINFPTTYHPVKLAEVTDIKNILELWGNSATMRYFVDPVRWNWKGKASEVWSDYALEVIQDPNQFLVICDLKDNGLSGFLVAKIEELPNYYQAKYSLTVEDFYLRPKDKKPELFKEMIEVLLKEAYSRKHIRQSGGKISMKIDVIEMDENLTSLLKEAGFKKSSVTFTASLD
ncbi:MAG: hypothetical protein SFU25_09070 [Candidatus Caenarcaniphilales bacterium]|nr:hypothetical protein [Candidatus Caenarcaniphilales bacterium]